MFLDARKIDKNEIRSDICIIGAGAAGISLARELVKDKLRICLLESGGLEPSYDVQSLYSGDVVGLPYHPLDAARLRFFGGTTGHWGGCCWPLEEIDFEEREWVPHSGWPFSRSELDPYYVRAQRICELGPYNYDAIFWSEEGDQPILPLDKSRVITKIYQNSSPPTRFGTTYRDDIEKAENISAILNASVTDIEVDRLNQSVSRVTAKTLDLKPLNVEASIFVIAAGGLENPRLLLLNNIGNHHDLVGRFFMDHIMLKASVLLIPKHVNTIYYSRTPINGTDIKAGLGLHANLLEKEQILNSWSGFTLEYTHYVRLRSSWDTIKSSILMDSELPDNFSYHVKNVLSGLRQLYGDIWKSSEGENELVTVPISNYSEQSPNPMSRVTLGDDLDKLGQRKIRLDWRLTDLDRRSIRRAQEIIAVEIGKSNLGRLKILAPEESGVWNDPKPASDVTFPIRSFHHMGTTRMHKNPKYGVVDENCKVHSIKNLYVAGSSVFPTCGYANATLTIVAMAHRLADHLHSVVKS